MRGQIGTPAMFGVVDPTKIPTEGVVLLRQVTLRPHSLPNQGPWRVRVPPLFLEQRKPVRFQLTHNQGLRQSFLTVWCPDLRH